MAPGNPLDALKKLRQQRKGLAKASEQYEVVDENSAIYEYYENEEEYKRVKQSRIKDDFIEGGGYTDEESNSDNEIENYRAPNHPRKRTKIEDAQNQRENSNKNRLLAVYFREKAAEIKPQTTKHRKDFFDDIDGLTKPEQSDDHTHTTHTPETPLYTQRKIRTHITNTHTRGSLLQRGNNLLLRGGTHMRRQSFLAHQEPNLTEESTHTKTEVTHTPYPNYTSETNLYIHTHTQKDLPKFDIDEDVMNTIENTLELDNTIDHSDGTQLLKFAYSNDILKDDELKEEVDFTMDTHTQMDMKNIEVCVFDDGSLPFYFLDAYEDTNTNLLYLFGKIYPKSANLTDPDLHTHTHTLSCCVIVEKMEICYYIQTHTPNLDENSNNEEDDNTHWEKQNLINKNVINEITHIKNKRGIKRLKIKPVIRSYCFDQDSSLNTHTQNYLKVYLPSHGPQFTEMDMKGTHYTHIFGRNTSLVDQFLVKVNIMGPGWLHISNFRTDFTKRRSWCNYEICVDDHKCVRTLDCKKLNMKTKYTLSHPKLNIMCVSVRSLQNKQKGQEIYAYAIHTLNRCNIHEPEFPSTHTQSKCVGINLVGKQKNQIENKNFICFENEKDLINSLIEKIEKFDPDILVGHNIFGDDFELLTNRCKLLNLTNWSKISRLKRPNSLKTTFSGLYIGRYLTVGRIVCDSYLQAKELLHSRPNYHLQNLVDELLPDFKGQYTPHTIRVEQLTHTHFDEVEKHIFTHLKEVELSLRIIWKLQALPLTKELTTIAGNLWAKSLHNARAERNDMLLCHEFHKRKYVCPDVKLPSKNKFKEEELEWQLDEDDEDNSKNVYTHKSKSKSNYLGGLVLEPKSGLYDTFILLLDFNSLYPSIIQEYNICFTTIHTQLDVYTHTREVSSISEEPGVLPKILERLVKKRRAVKDALKNELDTHKKASLEIRQLALKLTANSLYGCLGFTHSRFQAQPIAAYITRMGRMLLQTTKELVENELNYEIVYGDTDSIMINTGLLDDNSGTGYTKAIEIAHKIKLAVNKKHKSIEIDIDGVFRRLLLLKKKKYACVKILDYNKKIYQTENKGLDIVRRDWCGLAKEVGDSILKNIIFRDEFGYTQGHDKMVEKIHEVLRETKFAMDNDKLPISLYIITRSISRALHLYIDTKSQPHVLVATRMAKKGVAVRSGNEIQYIICSEESIEQSTHLQSTLNNHTNNESTKKFTHWAERAFSPEEVKLYTLKPDLKWYKNQQLVPVLTRLCGFIEGTDTSRLAGCLGLDPKSYGPTITHTKVDEITEEFENLEINQLRSSDERYKHLDLGSPIKCIGCGNLISMVNVLKHMRCDQCNLWVPLHVVRNWLHDFIFEISVGVTLHTNDEKHVYIGNDPKKQYKFYSPSQTYEYLEYLRYLLRQPLFPNDGQTNNYKTKTELVDISVDPQFNCTVLENFDSGKKKTTYDKLCQIVNNSNITASLGHEMKYPNIVAFIRTIDKLFNGTGKVDYSDEKKILLQMVQNILNQNGYSHIELNNLFSIFKPLPKAPTSV